MRRTNHLSVWAEADMGGFETQEGDLEVDSAQGTDCRAMHQCAVSGNQTDLQATAAPTPVSWWTIEK